MPVIKRAKSVDAQIKELSAETGYFNIEFKLNVRVASDKRGRIVQKLSWTAHFPFLIITEDVSGWKPDVTWITIPNTEASTFGQLIRNLLKRWEQAKVAKKHPIRVFLGYAGFTPAGGIKQTSKPIHRKT